MLELSTSPLAFGKYYTRFDLGGEIENGSTARVEQASSRAAQLWQDVFNDSQELILLVDDWDTSGREIWPSDPLGFLYSLIDDSLVIASSECWIRRDDFSHKRHFIHCLPRAIDSGPMLRAIAAREQGMTPRINQTVYCLDVENHSAFYMYDDRGCLIYSGNKDHCQALYELRADWVQGR